MVSPCDSERPDAGILAGGAGTRFGGRDKGWVEWNGRPLVQWVLDALRPQAGELLISANRNLQRYAALGARVITDADPADHQGPFAGMVQLLSAARAGWLLVVPCDAPRLPPDLASRFARCAAEQSADIVVLADAAGIHPTFCYLRTSLAADAQERFARGERAPRRWFARHRLARLVVDAPPMNLNSPEALAGTLPFGP